MHWAEHCSGIRSLTVTSATLNRVGAAHGRDPQATADNCGLCDPSPAVSSNLIRQHTPGVPQEIICVGPCQRLLQAALLVQLRAAATHADRSSPAASANTCELRSPARDLSAVTHQVHLACPPHPRTTLPPHLCRTVSPYLAKCGIFLPLASGAESWTGPSAASQAITRHSRWSPAYCKGAAQQQRRPPGRR